jgi:hypothetical protein
MLFLLKISGWTNIRPDNLAFLVSGIRPGTGFDLPDTKNCRKSSRISG